LTTLVRQVLQTGLEVEMTDHLGYERHDPAGRGSGNSRNGSHPKTVTTDIGTVRDRNSGFALVTVRKGQRRLDGLSGNVISLYAKGMTTGDIQAHLAEIYGTEISRDTSAGSPTPSSRTSCRGRTGPWTASTRCC
jgi:putative transposase